MKKYIVLFLVIVAACAETVEEPAEARREITEVLENQKDSWNRGELEGYMDHYLNSANLTFHSGSSLIRGWEELNSMYQRNYSGEGMGVLAFSEVKINVLSQDASYVIGAWEVALPDTIKKGRFTLILRKLDGEWLIIHDHSS